MMARLASLRALPTRCAWRSGFEVYSQSVGERPDYGSHSTFVEDNHFLTPQLVAVSWPSPCRGGASYDRGDVGLRPC